EYPAASLRTFASKVFDAADSVITRTLSGVQVASNKSWLSSKPEGTGAASSKISQRRDGGHRKPHPAGSERREPRPETLGREIEEEPRLCGQRPAPCMKQVNRKRFNLEVRQDDPQRSVA